MSLDGSKLKIIISVAIIFTIICCISLSCISSFIILPSDTTSIETPEYVDTTYDYPSNDLGEQLAQNIIDSANNSNYNNSENKNANVDNNEEQGQKQGKKIATISKSLAKLAKDSNGNPYLIYENKKIPIVKGSVKTQGNNILITLKKNNQQILIKA